MCLYLAAGYPRFFYDITVRAREERLPAAEDRVGGEGYTRTYRWGRESQRDRHVDPRTEKLLPMENMIFLDFIEDAADGPYVLEIVLLDGYFRPATQVAIPIQLRRTVAYEPVETDVQLAPCPPSPPACDPSDPGGCDGDGSEEDDSLCPMGAEGAARARCGAQDEVHKHKQGRCPPDRIGADCQVNMLEASFYLPEKAHGEAAAGSARARCRQGAEFTRDVLALQQVQAPASLLLIRTRWLSPLEPASSHASMMRIRVIRACTSAS